MFLTDISLKRPVFATVAILALVVLGVLSYLQLNINDWPSVELPYVAVTIVQPGASPEHLESKVAQKVEEAMGQISGVKHIQTTVQENMVTVVAEFTMETKPEVAAQDVRDKLGLIRGELPADIHEPIIARFDPMATPIMTIVVTGNQSLRELSLVVDDVIKERLETVNGVGTVNVNGDEKREIHIDLDKFKLAAYGLTTPEILGYLSGENLDVPIGSLDSAQNRIALRTVGDVNRVEDFNQLPIGRRGGIQLFVEDVAEVKDGVKDKEIVARYQGRPAIGLDVIKQSGSNTVQIANQIKKELVAIEGDLPPGVQINILRDNSRFIRDSLNDVVRTMVEGAILAVLIVFLFLKDWRSTLISAIAIPTSIISTFFAMKILGFTLNTVTLVALSLSVGLLIDDAIVVVENIFRHLHTGKKPLQAAQEATAEIGLAVTATTMAVVAVFLPVGMMSGIAGQFFKEFGLTVVFSVLVSLLVAFTIVPLLSARILHTGIQIPRGVVGKFVLWFNEKFDLFGRKYVEILEWVLEHRWKTLVVALALFVGSLALYPLLPSNFLTVGDTGELTLVAELDAGLSLDAAQRVTKKIEKTLQAYPEVSEVYSTTQTDESRILVKTVDKRKRDKSVFELAHDMRYELASIPQAQVSILTKDFANMEQKNFEFRLLGDDPEEMQAYADNMRQIMESIPGVVDVESSYKPGKPEGRLEVLRDEASDLGVSTGQIANTLRTLYTGSIVGQFEDKGHRSDVRVRLSGEQRQSLDDLTGIYLPSNYPTEYGMPAMISLNQLTRISFSSEPQEISRFDRSKEIVLSGNLYGTSLGEFKKVFLKRVNNEVKLPVGYQLVEGGYAEAMTESWQVLVLAMVAGILFIFFVMAAQFESFIDPLAIMFSLPLAIIGAILGLFLVGSDLSLVSMIGIIMLMGLVTKNAILLIDFAKRARATGVPRNEALLQAASVRLRPIMMTSLAMIFGMLPLALALGSGAESRSPMAHAIIGGLITSTMLTLLVVPVVYSLLDDLRNIVAARNAPRGTGGEPPEVRPS